MPYDSKCTIINNIHMKALCSPLKRYFSYAFAKDIPQAMETTKMNLFQAVNSALDIALETDKSYNFAKVGLRYSERMSNSVGSSDALAT